jgi:hypothetical protein
MVWPVAAVAVAGKQSAVAPDAELGQPLSPEVAQNPWLGVAHVSYLDGTGSGNQETRYAQAVAAGASWNRWAMYWTDIERSAGVYDYTAADVRVNADRAHGLQINAVLIATPAQYATAGLLDVPPPRIERKLDPAAGPAAWTQREAIGLGQTVDRPASAATSPPAGLYASTFADGTDNFAPGKAINAGNPWARFVNATAARYAGQVSAWEMWNEPDFSLFWSGSVADYARLLKVGYLAAKAADPSATVLVGGMMYWEWTNRNGVEHSWLRSFLSQLDTDLSRVANGYYFDGIPWHWYSRASDVYWRTLSARSLLAQHGIAGKAMWVNEANAPACGEPPVYAPCLHPGEPGYGYRGGATVDEQASFVIQAAAYGLAAGLDRFFIFQHYDDGSGEAFGLHRNDGSARPADAAYQVAAYYLRGATSAARYAQGDYEQVLVDAWQDGQPRRVSVVWKRTADAGSVRVPGSGSATLVYQTGQTQSVAADGAGFLLSLAGATDNRNFSNDPNDYIIGGVPLLLVGTDVRSLGGGPTATPAPLPSPTPTATPTPRPVVVGGLLKNGGFEAGTPCYVDWSWSCGGVGPVVVAPDAYAGTKAALLGSVYYVDPVIGGSNSTISQQVAIPARGSPFLRFAYRYVTQEPSTPPWVDFRQWPDRFEAIVVDGQSGAHYDFVTATATAGWTVQVLDLSAYRGQTISVIFNTYQSSADLPSMVTIDNAEIHVSQLWFPVAPNARKIP